MTVRSSNNLEGKTKRMIMIVHGASCANIFIYRGAQKKTGKKRIVSVSAELAGSTAVTFYNLNIKSILLQFRLASLSPASSLVPPERWMLQHVSANYAL